MSQPVTLQRSDRIATITLNRPDTRNALSGDVVDGLVDALASCEEDTAISCIILTGAGKSFSSGGNLNEISDMTAKDAMSPVEIENWYTTGIQKIPQKMNEITVPVIAAVNGHAIGAGCDLTTMADMRIAAEDAIFAESFLRVGLIPGDGGAWFLPRVIGFARASEMLFTAEGISAKKALEWGLVSQVVTNENLLSAAQALAERVVAQPPTALRKGKALMRATQNMSLDDSLQMAATLQGVLQQLSDHQEAITAIMEKRKPAFQGH
ncbi:enoyl-CoA hydratase [Chromatiales bacterium (ex Bugula neritina AB1)]|nr:enoyl-CoA hydratase [Chromatiales bacterium (ex Bugula neritina AB1)]